jgi:hypothetical protein
MQPWRPALLLRRRLLLRRCKRQLEAAAAQHLPVPPPAPPPPRPQYSASQGPIPHFATVYKSADQFTGKVKVKPGKPSAAKEIKFSAKLTNSGAVDSVAGLVVGWAKAIDATTTYGYVEGDYCAFSGTTVSVTAAPGDSPVIKAGKSKTVSVTVPAGALAPGTYVMSLVASSSNCSVNIGQPIYPSYTSFVVGA